MCKDRPRRLPWPFRGPAPPRGSSMSQTPRVSARSNRVVGPKLLPACQWTFCRFESWPSCQPGTSHVPFLGLLPHLHVEVVTPNSRVVSGPRQESTGTLSRRALRTEEALGEVSSHLGTASAGAHAYACARVCACAPRTSWENHAFPRSKSAAALSPPVDENGTARTLSLGG